MARSEIHDYYYYKRIAIITHAKYLHKLANLRSLGVTKRLEEFCGLMVILYIIC